MTIESLWLLVANLGAVITAAIIGSWLLYNRLRQIPPSTYAEMEQTIADMNRQMSDMRTQQAADHATIRELRREVNRLDEDMRAWRTAYAELVREFGEATGRAPESRPPGNVAAAVAVAPSVATSPAALLDLICDAFDYDGVEGLVFEMGLGRAVKGDTIEGRARSLIDVARRRGRLTELIELCRRERPNGGF